MGISIGGIDVASEIIELHFQLRRTQVLLEKLLSRSTGIVALNASDIQAADKEALEFVQKKFPDMGIQKKN